MSPTSGEIFAFHWAAAARISLLNLMRFTFTFDFWHPTCIVHAPLADTWQMSASNWQQSRETNWVRICRKLFSTRIKYVGDKYIDAESVAFVDGRRLRTMNEKSNLYVSPSTRVVSADFTRLHTTHMQWHSTLRYQRLAIEIACQMYPAPKSAPPISTRSGHTRHGLSEYL